MATRDQVLSLFGATPQQILERQRRSQAEFMAAQRDPFGQAGAAIGLGLARAFGKPSSEMQMAEQMQTALAGVDVSNPTALREVAKTISSFAPEQALRIATYANELEKSNAPIIQTTYKEVTQQATDATGTPLYDDNNQPIFVTKSIPLTGRYSPTGEFLGYVSGTAELGPVVDNTGIADLQGGIDLGDGVSLTIDKPEGGPVTAEELTKQPSQVATETMNVTPEAAQRIDLQGPRTGGQTPYNMPIVETAEPSARREAPPVITAQEEKTGIDAISDDAIIARYRKLKKKKGRKPSEDLLLKKLESQLLNRGLNEAL